MNRLHNRTPLFGWGILISTFLFLTAAVFVAAVSAQDPATSPLSAQAEPQCGLLVYEWNGEVTTADRGFPRQQPPLNNVSWTKPPNYAGGTLHLRVEIYDQPVVQDNMHLQLCFWQPKANNPANKFALETCSKQENVAGASGNVVTWSQDIEAMWKLNKVPLDWNRPRYRSAVAIKNRQQEDAQTVPVSDYNGWNWNGEKSKEWYPLNMHFTGRVTPAGAEFAGWDQCLQPPPTALTMQSLTGQQPAATIFTPRILLAITASLAISFALLYRSQRSPKP